MLNLRAARCPIDEWELIWFCVSQSAQSSQSHINRRENDQFMDFFPPVFTGAAQGGESVQKKPRGLTDFFFSP